jgi:hypothetical protein
MAVAPCELGTYSLATLTEPDSCALPVKAGKCEGRVVLDRLIEMIARYSIVTFAVSGLASQVSAKRGQGSSRQRCKAVAGLTRGYSEELCR